MTRPPSYDYDLDTVTEREFWARYHATPDYPSTERLRFVADAQLRWDLAELHEVCRRNDGSDAIRIDLERQAQKDHERRLRMTIAKALEGRLGESDEERQQARELAERLMPIDRRSGERQRDPSMMRQLVAALKSLRVHYSERDIEIDGGFSDGLPLSPSARRGADEFETRYP